MRYFIKSWVYLLFFSLSFDPLVYAQLGPYHGRVIDAETKQPIIDAAVLAIWQQRAPAPHPIITYHDALETLTDLNGNFTIPGMVGVPTDPNAVIDEPRFTIFKPGYEAVGGRRLKPVPLAVQEDLKVKDNVYEQNGIIVVELKRLTTREERLSNLRTLSSFSSCLPAEIAARLNSPTGLPYCIPEEKHLNLIRLRDIEEESVGLTPRRPRNGGQK